MPSHMKWITSGFEFHSPEELYGCYIDAAIKLKEAVHNYAVAENHLYFKMHDSDILYEELKARQSAAVNRIRGCCAAVAKAHTILPILKTRKCLAQMYWKMWRNLAQVWELINGWRLNGSKRIRLLYSLNTYDLTTEFFYELDFTFPSSKQKSEKSSNNFPNVLNI